jgi:hypothetical protein
MSVYALSFSMEHKGSEPTVVVFRNGHADLYYERLRPDRVIIVHLEGETPSQEQGIPPR